MRRRRRTLSARLLGLQRLDLAAQIVFVDFQGVHQAPGVQGPGEFQHAAERTAPLLQCAVEVIGITGRQSCALALDGLQKGRFPSSLPHAQLENKWEKRRYLRVDAMIGLFEAASFCVIHV